MRKPKIVGLDLGMVKRAFLLTLFCVAVILLTILTVRFNDESYMLLENCTIEYEKVSEYHSVYLVLEDGSKVFPDTEKIMYVPHCMEGGYCRENNCVAVGVPLVGAIGRLGVYWMLICVVLVGCILTRSVCVQCLGLIYCAYGLISMLQYCGGFLGEPLAGWVYLGVVVFALAVVLVLRRLVRYRYRR